MFKRKYTHTCTRAYLQHLVATNSRACPYAFTLIASKLLRCVTCSAPPPPAPRKKAQLALYWISKLKKNKNKFKLPIFSQHMWLDTTTSPSLQYKVREILLKEAIFYVSMCGCVRVWQPTCRLSIHRFPSCYSCNCHFTPPCYSSAATIYVITTCVPQLPRT